MRRIVKSWDTLKNNMHPVFTLALAFFIVCTASPAQPSDTIHALADKMASAFLAERYDEASLWANPDLRPLVSLEEVSTLTPEQAFAAIDSAQARRTSPFDAYLHLPNLARAAYAVGDLTKAEAYAREALAQTSRFKPLYSGSAVYNANQVLGRILLRKGDLSGAKEHLLVSGTTIGNPILRSFGPNMLFARDLLLAGERATVLEFLEECRNFWKHGERHIDSWESAIRAGTTPDFQSALWQQ